jgi:hypothetical protein
LGYKRKLLTPTKNADKNTIENGLRTRTVYSVDPNEKTGNPDQVMPGS